MERARRKADADKAYEVQVRAGTEGALKFTGAGIGLAVLGHYTWPSFRCGEPGLVVTQTTHAAPFPRRQTLAFKGFLVSSR